VVFSLKKLLKANLVLIACFIFVTALWTARAIAINYTGYSYNTYTNSNTYTSDEVAQQNILKDWQSGYRLKVAVGDDNWVIKYPLYVVTNNLPLSPIGQLLVTIIVLLTITAFMLVYSASRFINLLEKDKIKRTRYLILITIFLAVIPGDALFTFAQINSRNVEIGLTLFLLLQLYRSIFDKNWMKNHFRLKLCSLLVLLSVLIANDPLFLYMIVAPVFLVAIFMYLFKKIDNRYFWNLTIFIILSLIGEEVLKFLMVQLLPLTFSAHTSSIVSLPQFETNLSLLLNGGVNVFGINLWGDHFKNIRTVSRLIYLIIFTLSVCFIYRGCKKNKNIFYGSLVFILFWNFLSFTLNTIITNSTSERYLIYAIPIEIIGLILVIISISNNRQYYALLALLSCLLCFSLYTNTKTIINYHNNQTNTLDTLVISALEENGLTKGYGSYWLSEIQTYLSNNKIQEINISCDPGGSSSALTLNSLLGEDGAYYKDHPAKTFLVYSPAYDKSGCSPTNLTTLIGAPAKVLNFGGANGDYVAIYNYDIGRYIKN
jgi:hypothetical protein